MRTFAIVGVVGLVLALLGAYAFFWYPSYRGWGYAGYGGYHRGPSMLYWGGVNTYHSRSVRAGSRSGPGLRSGGIHGGK
jgi:hypothetical protein